MTTKKFDHSDVVPCVRDDVTECDCERCQEDEDDFWRTQEGELDEYAEHPDALEADEVIAP